MSQSPIALPPAILTAIAEILDQAERFDRQASDRRELAKAMAREYASGCAGLDDKAQIVLDMQLGVVRVQQEAMQRMARRKIDYQYRQKYDPTLRPSWRYDRVQRRIEAGKPLDPRMDDKLMHDLRRYLLVRSQIQRRIEDPDELDNYMAGRFTHIWGADRIFRLGRDARTRFILESQLLTDFDRADMAHRARCSVEAVDIYEKLFFNVSDKLTARDYIAAQVLDPVFMAGLPSKTPEMVCKYFAYFGGKHVLELVMNGIADEMPIPNEPSELSSWIDRQFRTRLRTTAMVGITWFDVTSYNIRTLIEGFQSLLSLSHKEHSQTGDENIIVRAVQQFININPAAKGDEADKLPARPGPVYGGGAVEPRVREIELLADGQDAPLLAKYQDGAWVDPKTRRRDQPQ